MVQSLYKDKTILLFNIQRWHIPSRNNTNDLNMCFCSVIILLLPSTTYCINNGIQQTDLIGYELFCDTCGWVACNYSCTKNLNDMQYVNILISPWKNHECKRIGYSKVQLIESKYFNRIQSTPTAKFLFPFFLLIL